MPRNQGIPTDNEVKNALLMELYAQGDYLLKPSGIYDELLNYFEERIPDDYLNKRYRQSKNKWANIVQWSRQHLVDEGYILPPDISGRGIWKLSVNGIEKAKQLFVSAYDYDPHKTIEDIAIVDIENIIREEEVFEGKKKERLSSYYERKVENRIKAIEFHGLDCAVCKFSFEKTYGDLGKGFIEVHHLIPISSFEREHIVNPKTEMTVLCANCHRMMHRNKGKVLSVDDLKRIVENKKI